MRFFVLNHPRTEAMTKRVALVFLILFLLFGNMKILKKPFPQLYKPGLEVKVLGGGSGF